MLSLWLTGNPLWFYGVLGILGLLVGSFLNVVTLRLPRILEHRWEEECMQFLNADSDSLEHDNSHERDNSHVDHDSRADEHRHANEKSGERGETTTAFSLAYPPSHCPHCKHPIRPWHNVPVIAWLWLRGRCPDCGAGISCRYPIVEGLTGIVSVYLGLQFGATPLLAGALLLSWALITLAVIDMDTQLLPDDITLPLLWLGLLFNLTTGFVPLADAVIGAVAGYLLLWSLYWGFKLLTGKEGMGYGDFKLLAALGAWLGWQSLPMILLLSSLVGAVVGIGLILLTRRGREVPIPYGPYLAAAGWISLVWGGAVNATYLRLIGV